MNTLNNSDISEEEIHKILSGLEEGLGEKKSDIPQEIVKILSGKQIVTDELLEKAGVTKISEFRAMRPIKDGSTYIGGFVYKNNTFSLNWHPERGWISKTTNNTSDTVKKGIEHYKGKLCSLLIPGDMLLGTKLGEWYEANEFHKFNVGDYIILKSENIVGYGFRPVGLVRDYFLNDESGKKVGSYIIEMIFDGARKEITNGISRISKKQKYFKRDIEKQFKRVNVNNREDALGFYK